MEVREIRIKLNDNNLNRTESERKELNEIIESNDEKYKNKFNSNGRIKKGKILPGENVLVKQSKRVLDRMKVVRRLTSKHDIVRHTTRGLLGVFLSWKRIYSCVLLAVETRPKRIDFGRRFIYVLLLSHRLVAIEWNFRFGYNIKCWFVFYRPFVWSLSSKSVTIFSLSSLFCSISFYSSSVSLCSYLAISTSSCSNLALDWSTWTNIGCFFFLVQPCFVIFVEWTSLSLTLLPYFFYTKLSHLWQMTWLLGL